MRLSVEAPFGDVVYATIIMNKTIGMATAPAVTDKEPNGAERGELEPRYEVLTLDTEANN
jgi:hypothetical protein